MSGRERLGESTLCLLSEAADRALLSRQTLCQAPALLNSTTGLQLAVVAQ
jgi:hypothetical protein